MILCVQSMGSRKVVNAQEVSGEELHLGQESNKSEGRIFPFEKFRSEN